MDSAAPARWTLLWADSEVATLRQDGDALCIRFAVARVRRRAAPDKGEGARGAAAIEGYVPGVSLHLLQAQLPAATAGCLGRLRDGLLRCDGRALRELSLPAALHGPTTLALDFASGASWQAEGLGLVVEAPDPDHFREDFRC